MNSLLSALVDRYEREPGRVQFTIVEAGRSEELTLADLLDGACRYAKLFGQSGCKPGDTVLIALQTGADLFGAFLGALWIGCVPAMMPFPSAKQDPDLFWRSHDTLFRHLGGGLILTYPGNADAVRENTQPGLMCVVTPDGLTGRYEGGPYPWRADEVCCVQHSSGTTGLKKGVALTGDAIGRQVASYAAAAGIGGADTIVSWLPLYHDMGFVTSLLLPLLLGNPVVVISPFEWLRRPALLFDLIEQYHGRYCWLPNFAFHHLARVADDSERRNLSAMKAFVNCSEPCKAETFDIFVRRFRHWGVRREQLQVSYGMAEAVFAITQTAPGHMVRTRPAPAALVGTARVAVGAGTLPQVVCTGAPISGVSVRTDSETGEILIRGPFVFSGYHRTPKPVLSDDGWFRTGDIGFIEDGEIYVLGRRKDLIVTMGRNVFAHELEALVSGVPGVKPGRTVAFGIFNPELGTEQVVVVAEEDGTAPGPALRRAIRSALESTVAVIPAQIVLVQPGWLVKSTSGKISRSGNKEKYLAMTEQTEAVA